MKTRFATLLSTALLLGCAASASNMTRAEDTAFEHMRARWQTRLLGDDNAITGAAIGRTGLRLLDAMSIDPESQALWDDAGGWKQSDAILASAVVTTNYKRLASMALAYAHPSSPLHGDARLRTAILYGLNWMEQNHYHAGTLAYGNWWDWQIGAPLALLDILALMHPYLDKGLLSRCLASVDYFIPDPTRRTLRDGRPGPEIETGANRLDKALAVDLRGVLGHSTGHIVAARNAIALTLAPVTRGDGFYRDGSFVQHTNVAYTGSYGLVALGDYAKLVYLHATSAWPLPDTTLRDILHWARDSFVPLLFDGAMTDAVRGRRVSSQLQDDHYAGRQVMAYLATLAEAAPAGQADDIRAAIKGNARRDGQFTASRSKNPGASYEMNRLYKLADDERLRAADPPAGARVYASMDRAIAHARDFGFVVSMYSDRISAFEFGNGENARGWWTGIGMTTLYTGDQGQYGENYWPTVDAWRLPGTTTDHSGKGIPPAWAMLGNRDGWSGGAQLDGYAAVALKFDLRGVSGSDLHGNKSWFLLGDQIIATGVGIGGGAGDVETIVENRRLSTPDADVLVADGNPIPQPLDLASDLSHVSWMHLSGSTAPTGIGYVFPDAGSVRVLREQRSGNWQAINSTESPANVHNTFLSLAIQHGNRPRNARYSYVILPGAGLASTAAYARRPRSTILENSETASAVRDKASGVIAANFWGAGMIQVDGNPYLGSNGPASIVIHETTGALALSVAEPTQHRTRDLIVELHQSATAALHLDPGISVLSLQPVLRLKIDSAGTAGRSIRAEFAP